MFKRIAVLSAFFLIAASVPVFAVAPDRVGKIDLGVYGAGAFNNEDADDAGYIGLNLSYGLTPYFAIGLSGGWQEADTNNSLDAVGEGVFMADLILRAPTLHDSLVPYGVLGLGAIGAYVERNLNSTNANDANDVDDKAFGWKLGGGVDWFVNSNWIAYFEAAYYDTDVSLPGTNVPSGVDFTTVGGGIKYVF